MPFQPGHDINRKSRLIHGTIKRAVLAEDGARLRAGIEKMLDLFAEGDPFAMIYIRDTLDGKPTQAVEIEQTINSIQTERPKLTADQWLTQHGVIDVIPQQINELADKRAEKECLVEATLVKAE